MTSRFICGGLVFLFFILNVGATAIAQGRIVVSHDVNTFANQYGGVPEQQFAVNVAEFLTENNDKQILVVESDPNDPTRNFSQTVKDALSAANFNVVYTVEVGFSLSQLQEYGAVFTGIRSPSDAMIDANILIEYVNQGGNVYVFAGVSDSPGLEASLLNGFLTPFGINFNDNYNFLTTFNAIITSSHPIFDDVPSLFCDNGNSLIDLGTNPNAEIVQYSSDQVHGLYAVIDPTVSNSQDNIFAKSFALTSYPNPFSDHTTIQFELPEATRGMLTVYNQLGQPVSVLNDGLIPAGISEFQWNGKGTQGVNLPNGLYFAQLKVKDHFITRKLILNRE